MAEKVTVHGRNKFTAAEIEHALLELALSNGNQNMASRRTGISQATIRGWAKKWPERYEEIKANLAPILEALAVEQSRRNMLRAAEVNGDLLEKASEATEVGNTDDVVKYMKAFQSGSIGQGIQTEKTLLLSGRPTEILEKRDTQQILKDLGDIAPGLLTVEGSAIDVTPQELPASAGS